MKTILEYLTSNLKPETLEKAMVNGKARHKELFNSVLEMKSESFKATIGGFFIWGQTDEGHQFWSDIESNNGDIENIKNIEKVKDVEEIITELRTKHGQLEDEGASSD